MGRGARTQRSAGRVTRPQAELHAAYLKGARAVRGELELLLDRIDEVIAAIEASQDLTAAQRSRLSRMLLRARTGYRGPLEP